LAFKRNWFVHRALSRYFFYSFLAFFLFCLNVSYPYAFHIMRPKHRYSGEDSKILWSRRRKVLIQFSQTLVLRRRSCFARAFSRKKNPNATRVPHGIVAPGIPWPLAS
jgi:hypothetical protein